METIKEEMQICLNELQRIDLSALQEALNEGSNTINELDIDIRINDKGDHHHKHHKRDF